MNESSARHRNRAVTQLIHERVLDPELAALLWLLADARVPIVVMAAGDAAPAIEVRGAIEALTRNVPTTADGAMPGGVLRGSSLEDALASPGLRAASEAHDHDHDHGGELPDEARDLGVVLILGEPDATGSVAIARAHYVRPVERDQGGHFQRRPPALLSAADEKGVLDHFFWAINDELATRTEMTSAEFEREHARRAVVLRDLVSAHVFDIESLHRHIDTVGLVDGFQQDEPN
jgi:hypothetical protein